MATALPALAEKIREAAWELALEYIDEGLRDDAVPSLQRLGQVGQLGDIPTFIVELSHELGDPQPARLRAGGPLATLVRDHAREREALGFAPREIVTEFLLLRRVLWRFVSAQGADERRNVVQPGKRVEPLQRRDRVVPQSLLHHLHRKIPR